MRIGGRGRGGGCLKGRKGGGGSRGRSSGGRGSGGRGRVRWDYIVLFENISQPLSLSLPVL